MSADSGSRQCGGLWSPVSQSQALLFLRESAMNEPVAMVDESGRWGKLSKYHPITLMFHDQPKPVNPHIERYEQHLADVPLPDISFHAGPLFNGHDDYEIPSTTDHKRLFIAFSRWRGTRHSRM